MPRRLRLAMVATLSGAGLLVSASLGTAQPSSEPLVIAVEGPQSGGQASNGLDQLRGVQLAVRQVNAHGGVLDRLVQIVKADDRGSAARARPVARAVIAKGIGFVIGPYNSSVGLQNLPLYRQSRVLPLWMTSSDDTQGAGITLQPMNSQIAPVESAYVKQQGAKKVSMLVDDQPSAPIHISPLPSPSVSNTVAFFGSARSEMSLMPYLSAVSRVTHMPCAAGTPLGLRSTVLRPSTYFLTSESKLGSQTSG